MPQPLSRVLTQASIRINGDYPLYRHPELAVLAAQVIASWSTVEAFMMRAFIDLMGGEAEKAATAFLALETQSAKSAAINAVASAYLPDDQQRLLRAILAVAKTGQKTRDKIAHWVWGDSPQITDGLLLLDPRNNIGADLNYDDIYVYKEIDFRNAIQMNERIAGFGFSFRWIMMGHIANRDGALYAQLCAEPEIQEKLNRQASQD
jgi:hypothetical protein